MEVKDLQPALVFQIFDEITKVPRPSKKEGKIRQYLLDFAAKHGIAVKTDAVGNVVMSKPATPGHEDAPGVILQGHMDMVCESNDKSFDFENNPIDNASMQVIENEYDGSIQAEAFIKGMAEGYNYGMVGYPKSAIGNNGIYSMLSDTQKELAYRLGETASKTSAKNRQSEIEKGKKLSSNKYGHKKGAVRGQNVKIDDLKKTFNDPQNIAYKILSVIAEATGIDIILYKSKTNESGNFKGNQGFFKKSNDTIYIDINAGLFNEKSAADLGKYAMFIISLY